MSASHSRGIAATRLHRMSTTQVPSLSYNSRAASWLREYLVVCVLVPTYLFAGICKLRYYGIKENVTGRWLEGIFQGKAAHNSLWPALNYAITESRVLLFLASWGNLFVELILPLAVLFLHPRSRTGRIARVIALPSWASFHLVIFAETRA